MTPLSMPAFAPLFRAGEETVGVRWLTVVYDVDADVARRALPAPLALPERPRAALWLGEFSNATFDDGKGADVRPPYLQGGVSLACARDGVPGAYALETFVAGLNHGILGRELFGLPKKQVRQVELLEADGRISFAIVSASDLRLLRGASVDVDETAGTELVPTWFGEHHTAKVIPSADGRGYDVCRLVRLPWTFADARVVQTGRAELHWSRSVSDPLYLLAERPSGVFAYGEATLRIEYGTYVAELDLPEPLGQEQWARDEVRR
ncbi:acetoacetate decarboxylase family protein [Nocardioides sp. BYT-33-1]|uniref:acetoacetate decarboxylase family protein n=1 Tax=Nocardioides sp. BYT-33-1 TaxID=3416952 RepID=UPI003F5335B1